MNDALLIGGKKFQSRLLVGTGKYKDLDETRRAIEASGAEIVTVAIRRTNIGQKHERAEPARRAAAVDATRSCPTPPAATPPKTRCAPAGWRASCSTATRWSSSKCWATRRRCIPTCRATLDGGRTTGRRRLRGDGLLQRRPDRLQAPGGDRLRRGDAAGRADRLGPGHPEPLQHSGHRRERQGADPGRCRRRHRLATPRSRWSWAATAC